MSLYHFKFLELAHAEQQLITGHVWQDGVADAVGPKVAENDPIKHRGLTLHITIGSTGQGLSPGA